MNKCTTSALNNAGTHGCERRRATHQEGLGRTPVVSLLARCRVSRSRPPRWLSIRL